MSAELLLYYPPRRPIVRARDDYFISRLDVNEISSLSREKERERISLRKLARNEAVRSNLSARESTDKSLIESVWAGFSRTAARQESFIGLSVVPFIYIP